MSDLNELAETVREVRRAEKRLANRPVCDTRRVDESHEWEDDTVDGDTCQCGDWYRFRNRIVRTPR